MVEGYVGVLLGEFGGTPWTPTISAFRKFWKFLKFICGLWRNMNDYLYWCFQK